MVLRRIIDCDIGLALEETDDGAKAQLAAPLSLSHVFG